MNSAAKVFIFKTLITSKLIDIKRIFLNIFLGVSLKKEEKYLNVKNLTSLEQAIFGIFKAQ